MLFVPVFELVCGGLKNCSEVRCVVIEKGGGRKWRRNWPNQWQFFQSFGSTFSDLLLLLILLLLLLSELPTIEFLNQRGQICRLFVALLANLRPTTSEKEVDDDDIRSSHPSTLRAIQLNLRAT